MSNLDFDLVARIRADFSQLKADLRKLPSQLNNELKVKIEAGSSSFAKTIVSENKKLVALFTKSLAVATGIAAGIGLLTKASPKLQTAFDRLGKIFLLFFKPAGDLIAKLVNDFSMWLRGVQKGRKVAVEAIGPEKTVIGEAAGAATGAGIGGAIGMGAGAAIGGSTLGAKIGAAVGIPAGPVGAGIGAGIGIVGGGAIGYFFGPMGLKGLEDALAGAQTAIGNFVKWIADITKPIWEPIVQATRAAWNFVYNTFIQPIVLELGQLFTVFGQIFSEIYTSVSTWIGKAWNFVYSNFIQPILGGLTTLASAVLETAIAWAKYIYNKFIAPVLKQFQEWYKELTEKVIKPIVEWMNENVIKPLQNAWNNFAETVKSAWEAIKQKIQEVYNVVKPIIDFIKGGISAAGQAISQGLYGAAEAVRGLKPPTKQVGGLIPETGLYMMHRGEFVTSAARATSSRTVNFSPIINISATTEKNLDEDRLAEIVMKKMSTELARLF